MAEVSDQIESLEVIPDQYSSQSIVGYQSINTALFVALCTSSLSAGCSFLCMKPQPLSKNMEPIATYVGDFVLRSLGNAYPSKPSQLYIWVPVAVFWVSYITTVLRKRHDATYLATPIALSASVKFLVGFTIAEYGVLILPLILSLWELLSDY